MSPCNLTHTNFLLWRFKFRFRSWFKCCIFHKFLPCAWKMTWIKENYITNVWKGQQQAGWANTKMPQSDGLAGTVLSLLHMHKTNTMLLHCTSDGHDTEFRQKNLFFPMNLRYSLPNCSGKTFSLSHIGQNK